MIRKRGGMTVGVSINRPLTVVMNGTMMMTTDAMNLVTREEVNSTSLGTEMMAAVA